MNGRPLWLVAVLVSAAFAACSDDGDNGTDLGGITEPQLALSYIGSESCGYCHAAIFSEFRKSGHPYKLNKVEDGQPPTYPFSDVPSPPAGYTWNDVSYVIGGYGWKARFLDTEGYIITVGGNNQYNLATGTFSDYHADEQKPYDCGGCHTTGYEPVGSQDGLEGVVGTWAYPGVQCEECHGPGSLHADNPRGVRVSIDTRAEACGRCHNRGGVNDEVMASGGFIRHHEQYNEMTAGPHEYLECVTCHDPHVTAKYDDLVGAQAIVTQCEDCHTEARVSLASASLADVKADFACESCHMPLATKSAVASGEFVADIPTHIVAINPDMDALQFNEGLSNPYMTLDFACLGCHEAEDRAWAASYVDDIHGTSFSQARAQALVPTR